MMDRYEGNGICVALRMQLMLSLSKAFTNSNRTAMQSGREGGRQTHTHLNWKSTATLGRHNRRKRRSKENWEMRDVEIYQVGLFMRLLCVIECLCMSRAHYQTSVIWADIRDHRECLISLTHSRRHWHNCHRNQAWAQQLCLPSTVAKC